MAVAALGGRLWTTRWGGWLGGALADRLSVVSLAVALAAGLGLLAVWRLMWRLGRPVRQRRRDGQEGQVMVEFAFVLPLALMLVLVMAQSSLLLGGNLCVHYAAWCAARAAAVQVPADRRPTEPPNYVAFRDSSAKLRRIHLAATWAIMPVAARRSDLAVGGYASPDARVLVAGLRSYFAAGSEPGWLREDYLRPKLDYADSRTTVKLQRWIGQDYQDVLLPATFDEDAELHVRVEHVFYLTVPYADRVFYSLEDSDSRVELGQGAYGLVIHAASSVSNEGLRDWIDVEGLNW